MPERDWGKNREALKDKILTLRPDFISLVQEIDQGQFTRLIAVLGNNSSSVPKFIQLDSMRQKYWQWTENFLDKLSDPQTLLSIKQDKNHPFDSKDESVYFLMGLLDARRSKIVFDEVRKTWSV